MTFVDFSVTVVTATYVMLCAIWYHLYNLKNVKNTHGEVLLLGSIPPWVFLMFFELYKWY